MAANKRERRVLEHLESYLARRDGVDKLLKISRYAAKLALAAPRSPPAAIAERLRAFESSVGTSRKAFRLGKFIQDLNALIKARESHQKNRSSSIKMLLELVAYGGEGVYFFIEQFVWLAKAGLIDKRNSKPLQKMSAWAEFIGYFGSVVLKYMEVSAMIQEENRVIEARGKKADDGGKDLADDLQMPELKSLREKKLMKSLSLVQDFADSLLALSDIRDGRGRLSDPFLLAFAGLVSALISTHKTWLSC